MTYRCLDVSHTGRGDEAKGARLLDSTESGDRQEVGVMHLSAWKR